MTPPQRDPGTALLCDGSVPSKDAFEGGFAGDARIGSPARERRPTQRAGVALRREGYRKDDVCAGAPCDVLPRGAPRREHVSRPRGRNDRRPVPQGPVLPPGRPRDQDPSMRPEFPELTAFSPHTAGYLSRSPQHTVWQARSFHTDVSRIAHPVSIQRVAPFGVPSIYRSLFTRGSSRYRRCPGYRVAPRAPRRCP
jgi:hypothetical protein